MMEVSDRLHFTLALTIRVETLLLLHEPVIVGFIPCKVVPSQQSTV